ncbi:UNVERIFIED_CONTAM: hypothetical protein GTU68_013987 [Idotea baltica]|nr:hypothetical protein [Idotea baltica]
MKEKLTINALWRIPMSLGVRLIRNIKGITKCVPKKPTASVSFHSITKVNLTRSAPV